jgi:adenosylhomocysteine nucleosidase
MIAITFALPAESSRFVDRVRNKRRSARGNAGIIYGEIEQRQVAIFHTGVAQKACQKKIDDFLRVEHPDFLISSGFAGGIRDDLRVGDLFLGENFSDRQLLFSAQKIFARRHAHSAKLFTSTSIIDSLTQRKEMSLRTSAAAVDMETETIARACEIRGIRLLSLRLISDSLSEPLPASPRVLFDIERQRTNYTKLLTHLLIHPVNAVSFIRFYSKISRARKTLADAIIDVVRNIEP